MLERELFFGKLVENKVVRHKHSTNGKLVDVSATIVDRALSAECKSLYARLPKTKSYDEFQAEFIWIIHRTVMNFEIKDNGSWEGILNGTDKANINRIYKIIKTTSRFELHRYVNNIKRMYVDGEKLDIKTEVESLDAPLCEEDLTLLDVVERSLWDTPEDNLIKTEFLEWFEENKDKFLLKSQLEFLAQGDNGNTKNRARSVKSIEKRTINAWEKYQATKKSVPNNKELAFLIEGLNIADNNRDEIFVLWLSLNIDKPYLLNLLYDNFEKSSELVKVIKGSGYKQQTLYKIYSLIEQRVKLLNQGSTTFKEDTGAEVVRESESRSKVYTLNAFGLFEQVKF